MASKQSTMRTMTFGDGETVFPWRIPVVGMHVAGVQMRMLMKGLEAFAVHRHDIEALVGKYATGALEVGSVGDQSWKRRNLRYRVAVLLECQQTSPMKFSMR